MFNIETDKEFSLTVNGGELIHIFQALKIAPAPFEQTSSLLQKLEKQIVTILAPPVEKDGE